MEKITGSINAYVMPPLIERMRQAILEGDTERALSCMSFMSSDYATGDNDPWPLVGRATVTVTVPDDDQLRAGVLSALEKRREQVIAEKTAELARIDDKINQLLALAYEAPQ